MTQQQITQVQNNQLNTNWQDFPLVLEGVQPSDITNYICDLDGQPHGLADLVDVVTYYRYFQPIDIAPEGDADLISFSYEHAIEIIEAAREEDLSVIIPFAWTATHLAIGDGELIENSGTEELWIQNQTIRIPLQNDQLSIQNDQISFDFVDYWQDKLNTFITALTQYDDEGTIWAFRGIDELRYWRDPEVYLARAMRDQVEAQGGQRALVTYSPNHYLPERSLLYTLVDKPITGDPSPNLLSVEVSGPADPAAHLAEGDAVISPYPELLEVYRSPGGYIRQLFEHVIAGNFTGLVLGDYAHQNRILAYHRVRCAREAVTNIEQVYAVNAPPEGVEQPAPAHIAYHVPDVYGAHTTSPAEARHDFWAGLHEGQGIWLGPLGRVTQFPDTWEQYVRGLRLIKAEMRSFLVDGQRSTLQVAVDATTDWIAGNDYLVNTAIEGAMTHALSMPGYMALNNTLLRIGNVGYLMVTQSLNQALEFEAALPGHIENVTVVAGSSNQLAWEETRLRDVFDGIDGRVYRIEFDPNAG